MNIVQNYPPKKEKEKREKRKKNVPALLIADVASADWLMLASSQPIRRSHVGSGPWSLLHLRFNNMPPAGMERGGEGEKGTTNQGNRRKRRRRRGVDRTGGRKRRPQILTVAEFAIMNL